MNVDTQAYLRLVENAHTLAFVDIEATGLKGDYNSILCVSIKPFGKPPTTFAVQRPGNDQKVVREAKALLETMDCWATYYGRGFDMPMMNTRLFKWGLDPLESRHHIDLYYKLKSALLASRRSQAFYQDWLKITPDADEYGVYAVSTPDGPLVKKMSVSADEWNRILESPKKVMPTMVKRCESDVAGLEALYKRSRHLIKDVTR